MADKKDYYETLGVAKDANADDIKSSYRKLARQYHPDVTKEDPKHAEERFKDISEAYEVLMDPEKRKLYDNYGRAGVSGQFSEGDNFSWQDFSHGEDLNDIFGDMSGSQFGNLFEFFGGGQQRGPRQGQHLRLDIEISLEEAARGVKREITAPMSIKCDQCNGTGSKDGRSHTCKTCGGKGQVQRVQHRGNNQFVSIVTCPKCGGKGKLMDHPCPKCDGGGYLHKPQKIEINIPKGVDTGMQLRVPGAGEMSPNGGQPGNLFIVIHVREHQIFKRDGANLMMEQDIAFADAALGGEIKVPTLFGSAKLTIPPGTQTGTEFRLRGAGLDLIDSRGKGDQVVRVRVKVPRKLSNEQKEQLRKFSKLE
ncbi:MAG: molecular chaperone DnaJ [Methanomassiliicoccales archaeon]|jgi:molecular chaperone DnaJ